MLAPTTRCEATAECKVLLYYIMCTLGAHLRNHRSLIVTSLLHAIFHLDTFAPSYLPDPEISLEYIGVGAILGEVKNHIKAFMLHPVKDQSGLLIEDP